MKQIKHKQCTKRCEYLHLLDNTTYICSQHEWCFNQLSELSPYLWFSYWIFRFCRLVDWGSKVTVQQWSIRFILVFVCVCAFRLNNRISLNFAIFVSIFLSMREPVEKSRILTVADTITISFGFCGSAVVVVGPAAVIFPFTI